MEAKLSAEVDKARAELNHRVLLLQNYRESRAGVKQGDIVRHSGGQYPGMEFRVTNVWVWETGSTAWVRGAMKKKDGTWGIAERNLYSHWEMVNES